MSPGSELRAAGQSASDAAHALVTGFDRTCLAIQGPPGSGKTWTGARLILDLVARGQKVGVTANSHKVIGKVLDEVAKAALDDPRFARGVPRLGQKPAERGEPTCATAQALGSAADVRRALDGGDGRRRGRHRLAVVRRQAPGGRGRPRHR